MGKIDKYLKVKTEKKPVPARVDVKVLKASQIAAKKKGVTYSEFVEAALMMACEDSKSK